VTVRRHPNRIRRQWWSWALLGVVAAGLVIGASARAPTVGVSDERLYALSSQLKCQQCVGESVAGSQSPSAVQFRAEISRQMSSGRSDDEILNFFAQRYGSEVLLTPPSSGVGGLVWVLPVLVVAAAAAGLASTFRRWSSERSERSASPEQARSVAEALARRSAEDGPVGHGGNPDPT
jgi:cytochrome c-type biogenesis protein CcmH